ncbi:MAG: TonB-dependent receptor [Gemmatimonadaceae bacterium]|nr:TonB-dependent receptor [Chitinophagaceae bacterium]
MRFLLLIILLPCLVNAQSLSGRVEDEKGVGLSAVSLAICRVSDSIVTKYLLTDEAGNFRLNRAPPFPLLFRITSTGYQSVDTILNSNAIFLFRLKVSTKTLSNVVVSASKPLIEVMPEKTVFNVSQSIIGSGGNAFELLQKSPGVVVDPGDGITMNGKSGVRIYIDGRPSPLSLQELAAMLRSMPATDVDAIEIISNPSSRYEAAGNAGIINLRLKKSKSLGTNGTVSAGWSLGMFPKYNGSISINHRTKKINVFGSYSSTRGSYEGYLNLYRYQNDSIFDQRSVTGSKSRSQNIKIGTDWTISRKHTLGILGNINLSTNKSDTKSHTPIAGKDDKQIAQILQAETNGNRHRRNGSINLNYRFADTIGRSLSVDMDYGYFDLDGNASTQNRYSDQNDLTIFRSGFSNQTPVTIRFAAAQAGWEMKWKGGRFNAGWRSALAATDNRFSFFNDNAGTATIDKTRSNDFKYTENIHAAYAQFQKQKKKWGYQFGLRLEQTESLGELTAVNNITDQRVKRSYLNVFPSAGITYQPHAKHGMGLSYSRRIDRPSYQDLNPFENRIDELTYQKGNPFLRPQFTDNIEIKHTYAYKLTTILSFSDVKDFFASITDTIEGRRNFITQQNITRQRVYSLSAALPFKFTSWWSGYASAGVNHNRYRSDFGRGKEIRINATVANIYQQHTFIISKKWTGELSSFYLSPYVWGGTYKCRSIWNIDLGLQTKILNEQATIRLSFTDIFQRLPWSGTSRLGSLYIAGKGGWESRQVRLNLSYRFGRKEIKASRQRATSLEDLNKRVQ